MVSKLFVGGRGEKSKQGKKYISLPTIHPGRACSSGQEPIACSKGHRVDGYPGKVTILLQGTCILTLSCTITHRWQFRASFTCFRTVGGKLSRILNIILEKGIKMWVKKKKKHTNVQLLQLLEAGLMFVGDRSRLAWCATAIANWKPCQSHHCREMSPWKYRVFKTWQSRCSVPHLNKERLVI